MVTSTMLGLILGALLLVLWAQIKQQQKRRRKQEQRKKFDINDYREN